MDLYDQKQCLKSARSKHERAGCHRMSSFHSELPKGQVAEKATGKNRPQPGNRARMRPATRALSPSTRTKIS